MALKISKSDLIIEEEEGRKKKQRGCHGNRKCNVLTMSSGKEIGLMDLSRTGPQTWRSSERYKLHYAAQVLAGSYCIKKTP